LGGFIEACSRSLRGFAAVATMKGSMKNFERITVDPAQMGGVPCVRHLRIPVATVLRLLAGGLTEREILAEYPDLDSEDIRECLRFAAASAMGTGTAASSLGLKFLIDNALPPRLAGSWLRQSRLSAGRVSPLSSSSRASRAMLRITSRFSVKRVFQASSSASDSRICDAIAS
jgi:uncharacterized protein (DUF433 family)